MKNCLLHTVAFAVLGGVVLITGPSAYSDESDPDQAEFPKITRQPEDQAIHVGSSATLTADAVNADSYQWMRNGVVMENQTNSTLIIEDVKVENVGLYTCYAFKDSEAVPTRTASLNVYAAVSGGGPIVIFGTPVPGGGNPTNSCPGPYAGYVNYVKPPPTWGWVPTTGTFHTATDTNRTDTKIAYGGRYGDTGCGQTTVTIPHPPMSPKYRFTLYFPNNVPTNAYPMVLEGFNP